MDRTTKPDLTDRVTLTVDETARLLGCSRRQVYRLMGEGLPVVYFGSRRWVPVARLRQWVDERTVTATV